MEMVDFIIPELQLVIVEYYDSDLNWDDPGSDGFEMTMLILDAQFGCIQNSLCLTYV